MLSWESERYRGDWWTETPVVDSKCADIFERQQLLLLELFQRKALTHLKFGHCSFILILYSRSDGMEISISLLFQDVTRIIVILAPTI